MNFHCHVHVSELVSKVSVDKKNHQHDAWEIHWNIHEFHQCIMALLKDVQLEILVSIGSGNGLVPIWHQANTQTNATLTSVRPSKAYEYEVYMWKSYHKYKILSTLYAVLTQFVTRFTACTGGILVSVIEARLFKIDI